MAAKAFGIGSPGNVLDSKIVSAHASNLVDFPQGSPNAILLDAAGTVTIRKIKDGASEAFALAGGVWVRMAPFDLVTAASVVCHVGLVE